MSVQTDTHGSVAPNFIVLISKRFSLLTFSIVIIATELLQQIFAHLSIILTCRSGYTGRDHGLTGAPRLRFPAPLSLERPWVFYRLYNKASAITLLRGTVRTGPVSIIALSANE